MSYPRWSLFPLVLAFAALCAACGPGVLALRAETLRSRTCACGEETCYRQAGTEGRALAKDVAAQRVSEADRAAIHRAAVASRRCLLEGYWWRRARVLADRLCACETVACVEERERQRQAFSDEVAPLRLVAADQQPITAAMRRAHRCRKGEIWARRAEQIRDRACGCEGPLCFPRFMDDLKRFKDDAGRVKVTKAIAERIRASTEAGMRCAVKQLRSKRPSPP